MYTKHRPGSQRQRTLTNSRNGTARVLGTRSNARDLMSFQVAMICRVDVPPTYDMSSSS